MKYFITIYIETMKPKVALLPISIPHTFLGLTRKHPDELDSMTFERETYKQIWDFKLGKMIYLKEEVKWYTFQETNEFNDGFYGFGTGTGGFINTAGKVFENNHLRR